MADGDTVIYRTLRVGRTYTAEANYRLLVSVGVPSAVDITLNGQPVNLRDKDSRRISRVEINQVNISELLTTKDKTGEPTTSATGGTETNDNSSSDDGN